MTLDGEDTDPEISAQINLDDVVRVLEEILPQGMTIDEVMDNTSHR